MPLGQAVVGDLHLGMIRAKARRFASFGNKADVTVETNASSNMRENLIVPQGRRHPHVHHRGIQRETQRETDVETAGVLGKIVGPQRVQTDQSHQSHDPQGIRVRVIPQGL